MIKPPGSYTNPFSAKVVEILQQAQRDREQRAAIYEDTKQIVEKAFKTPDPAAFAAAVARASAKARGEIADETPRFSDDEHGRRAKQICNAARRARGQEPFK
jgi:F0F1-type ATP synthase membrane subunit b/b'